MRVVVGLGNPGREYAVTRHNVGFLVVEGLAERWGVSFAGARACRTARAHFRDEPVLLVEPLMYMNRTGDALTAARILPPPSPEDLIVVHDDLDFTCGRVGVKVGGGTGGHRGLESIAACLGSDFVRVRIGIGRPPAGVDAVDYVLTPFPPENRQTVRDAIERAADAVEAVLTDGAAAAMNTFNRRPTPA